VIRDLAIDSDFWFGNVWIADSTPVECGRRWELSPRDPDFWAAYSGDFSGGPSMTEVTTSPTDPGPASCLAEGPRIWDRPQAASFAAARPSR
jgi:hypothetical protein